MTLTWQDQGNDAYCAKDETTGLSAQVMKSGIGYFWFIADLPCTPCSSDNGYRDYEGRASTAREAMAAAENAMPDEEQLSSIQAEAESLWQEWL